MFIDISFLLFIFTLFIYSTVYTGNYPFAVYPDVIIQSALSSTAFVISDTSALVGLGLVYID